MAAQFLKGSEARVRDHVCVQAGGHAGKTGYVGERQGKRLLVCPFSLASWIAFWIDDADVATVRYL